MEQFVVDGHVLMKRVIVNEYYENSQRWSCRKPALNKWKEKRRGVKLRCNTRLCADGCTLNLLPILTPVQFCKHNCHAHQLNLRKCDTSNCKLQNLCFVLLASHQECDTSKATTSKLRATTNFQICNTSKTANCKLREHFCTGLASSYIRNCFANTKCKLHNGRKDNLEMAKLQK